MATAAVLAGIAAAACAPAGVQVVPTTSQGSSNGPPSLSGAAATSAVAGTTYSFQPAASDPDQDVLAFSIANKPSWASFNTTTGALSGTAAAGTYPDILISVSDGQTTRSLPAFTLSVTDAPAATGTATLSWAAPGAYTDGSTLQASELAGYRIYHGTSAINLSSSIPVPGAGTTTYTVGRLATGTHYFAVSAVTITGAESALSQIGSKTIP